MPIEGSAASDLRGAAEVGDVVGEDRAPPSEDTDRVAARHELPATALLSIWPLLPTLRLVVELGGVRAASAALGVQASAVSKNLRHLESLVGAPLFHRVGRSLVPTALATTLQGQVRAAMRGVDSVVRTQPPLRIVMHPAAQRRVLLAATGLEMAAVTVSSETALSLAQLRSGVVDVVVGVGDSGDDDGAVVVVGIAVLDEVEIGDRSAGHFVSDHPEAAIAAVAAGLRAWIPRSCLLAGTAVLAQRQRRLWAATRTPSTPKEQLFIGRLRALNGD